MAEGQIASKTTSVEPAAAAVHPTTQARPSTGWLSTFKSFELPVYRTVWLGTIMSFLAFNTWGPANGVVAFDLTGSNGAVGLVVFGQGLAQSLLNPFTGAIADRVSKRDVVLACQIVAFAVMAAVGLLVVTHQINIVLLALAAFVVGTMFSFNGPARNALIADLMPEERLGN